MSYENFAFFYDELTRNIDYKMQLNYLLTLLKKNNHEPGLTLDLACGTGSLTLAFKSIGVDIYGVDSSPAMLTLARKKTLEAGEDILFLCQKMQDLNLFGTVDTVISTLDSVNHLRDLSEVKQTFSKISLFLNPDGYFIFDMNTIYKHKNILASHTFIYETKNVYCVWQNHLQSDERTVRIELDLFENHNRMYKRYYESFYESAFTLSEIESALSDNGLDVIGFFGEGSLSPPKVEEQRVFVVAKKRGK